MAITLQSLLKLLPAALLAATIPLCDVARAENHKDDCSAKYQEMGDMLADAIDRCFGGTEAPYCEKMREDYLDFARHFLCEKVDYVNGCPAAVALNRSANNCIRSIDTDGRNPTICGILRNFAVSHRYNTAHSIIPSCQISGHLDFDVPISGEIEIVNPPWAEPGER